MTILLPIVNVTPDSFSDGGAYNPIDYIKQLQHMGANIVDIGAESTRPNATILGWEEEISRLQSVIDNCDVDISLDSYHPETIHHFIDNIKWINDVSGFENNDMIDIAAKYHKKCVVMHNLGVPANRDVIVSGNVVQEVVGWGRSRISKLIKRGIKRENIIFDIGLGFGKNAKQSIELLANIDEFRSLDVSLLVGHSRKSFILDIDAEATSSQERDFHSAVISALLVKKKVDILRVHNYSANKMAIDIARKI